MQRTRPCSSPLLPPSSPPSAQIISLVAKLQGPDAPCPEPQPASGAGPTGMELRARSLAEPRPSITALALPSDRTGGTSSLGAGAAPLDRRRQLAVAGALASRAVKKHASNGGRAVFTDDNGALGADSNGGGSERAGSQSPRGPQTPVEGAHLLALHPATRQFAGGCRCSPWAWGLCTRVPAGCACSLAGSGQSRLGCCGRVRKCRLCPEGVL